METQECERQLVQTGKLCSRSHQLPSLSLSLPQQSMQKPLSQCFKQEVLSLQSKHRHACYTLRRDKDIYALYRIQHMFGCNTAVTGLNIHRNILILKDAKC